MKTAVLLLFFFAARPAAAQEPQYFNWKWEPCDVSLARFYALVKKTDSGWYRNDFYISTNRQQMSGLYSDAETKTAHGWFRYYYPNGSLSAAGRFVNGKRQGLWLSYHYNGMMSDSAFYESGQRTGICIGWHSNGFISDSTEYKNDGTAVEVTWFDDGTPAAAGRYLNRKKDGPWQYFHINGNLAAKEKYGQGVLISRVYYDENGLELADTANRDRDAEFKGGGSRWQDFLENNLLFPDNVKLVNTDRVTIVVDAIINEDGKVSDAYVSVPFNAKFDDEALRIMNKSPKWTPATRYNRRVKQRIRQSVTFVQTNE